MMVSFDPETGVAFAGQLLAWFSRHARDLPWRRERTSYRVWVAEVMLQQTRAETVVPYYERFLSRFPTVEALAGAPLEDVLKVWEGLGYYARARNLHAAARQVVATRSGRLPDTFAGLVALPGVGRYIGGAVASIAFGRDVAAVDGNARRVLCRAFGIREDVTRSGVQRKLEALANDLIPPGRAGAFNEALMELGATVCTPRSPRCDHCPLAAAVTVRADGRVLVAQRNIDDMLGGLWEFPGGKREEGETLAECLVREMREELDVEVGVGELLIVVEHAYTHFRITLHAFLCRLVAGEPRCLDCAAFRWATRAELEPLPMSVVDRKVAQALDKAI